MQDWIATARHPQFERPYTEMVYQPMLEVLAYLRANGFKTFIVSGGGVEFMRALAEQVYGIPPEQVIGSSGKRSSSCATASRCWSSCRRSISSTTRRASRSASSSSSAAGPIAAFGNSDGDLQMLQWTTAGDRRALRAPSSITTTPRASMPTTAHRSRQLDEALDEAAAKGWTVVSMKDDWKTVFPAASTGNR